VKKDFISLGLSLKLTAQVAWLVKNHLLMSSAAFRQNPHAQQTWSELFRRGVKGRRIAKLAVLTAIDIRATNPEAWNDWKEKLLYDLAVAMQSPKASRLSEFLEKAEKRKLRLSREFLEHLDSRLLENLPLSLLLKDIEKLQKKSKSGSAEPLIIKNRQRQVWLRFHEETDRPGLFKEFVERIYSTGAQIQEAYVQTDSIIGAYDWFKIKTTMATPQLKKALLRSASLVKANSVTVIKSVQFEKIKVVTQTDTSAVISFRGRDQKGALLAAAQALYSAGLEIESAQVHTWGRQIDDVFTVKKPPGEQLSQLVQGMLVQES
jgi:[protein-PII] uridylyltransferase